MKKIALFCLLFCSTVQPMFKECGNRVAVCLCAKTNNVPCKVSPACANMFFEKQDERLIKYPFSWGENDDIFEGQEYRSHLLCVLIKERFYQRPKEIGGTRYTYRADGPGFVEAIIFHEEWRNKGLGFLVLQRALAEMDEAKVKTVELSVSAHNLPAIRLYEKCGFIIKTQGHKMQRTLPTQDS